MAMLQPEPIFAAANAVTLPCWLALAVSLPWPRSRRYIWWTTGAVVPALLAMAYIPLIATGMAQAPAGGFGSIGEVRALFANDAALTAGWLHYLAFDLVVGTLIVREGLVRHVHPLALLPCLPLTFLFGPTGLLLFLLTGFAAHRVAAR